MKDGIYYIYFEDEGIARIDVHTNDNGDSWPIVTSGDSGFGVREKDGRWTFFPWHSIKKIVFEPIPNI